MVSEPRPWSPSFHSAQQDRNSTPGCCFHEHRTSSPHDNQLQDFLLRRTFLIWGHLAFFIPSPATIAKAKSQASPVEKWWVSLFHPLPSREMEALAWVWHAETIVASTALDLTHETVASHEERPAQRISDCLPSPTDYSVPQRESCHCFHPQLHSSNDFSEGKQTITQIIRSSQKNWLSLQKSMEKFKPNVCSQDSGGYREKKIERFNGFNEYITQNTSWIVCRRESGNKTAKRNPLRSEQISNTYFKNYSFKRVTVWLDSFIEQFALQSTIENIRAINQQLVEFNSWV